MRALITKWPGLEVVAQSKPQAVEPSRLEYEEQDDEQAEDDRLKFEDVQQAAVAHTSRGGDKHRQGVDEFGQHDDEDRTHDGAGNRGESTDEDHRQEVDGQEDIPRLG